MILVTSFTSSFRINKVNPFFDLIPPFHLFFFSNLFTAFKVKLLTNPDKMSLARGIPTFANAFLPKLANQ